VQCNDCAADQFYRPETFICNTLKPRLTSVQYYKGRIYFVRLKRQTFLFSSFLVPEALANRPDLMSR
jgi:hypothetical protein